MSLDTVNYHPPPLARLKGGEAGETFDKKLGQLL